MSLYTVRFTTRRVVTRYGAKREILSEETLDVPVTMKDLPLSTAQTYSQCDGFQIERQFASVETKTTYRKSGRNGRGYRDVEVTSVNMGAPKRGKKVDMLDAARTGDMGAALNG